MVELSFNWRATPTRRRAPPAGARDSHGGGHGSGTSAAIQTQEYFTDGMVEDIITGLSRKNWLFVIARNSTFTYKNRAIDVKQVGRELGVRYVLEGSVRRVADRIRVAGQLIDAVSGAHVWAERYDRKSNDIVALQDEITLSVVGAIEPSLRLANRAC